jgi:aldehyde:ferredoxin oxidoreductase
LELKLLRVNLTNGTFKDQVVGDRDVRKWLGGRGLGAYLAFKEIPKRIDPLGPENKVYILTGPITGTPFPESGRYHVISKSPQSGILGDSNSGGKFGPWLRFSGYDGIVVEGKASEPQYLSIVEGEPKLNTAEHLWGKGVINTDKKIREEMKSPTEGSILAIGPAGEKLENVSAIMNDIGRAAGRTGLAAVLGSKKLKAIFVKGKNRPEIVDKESFSKVAREKHDKIKKHPVSEALNRYGTAVLVNMVNGIGAWPTRNYSAGTFEEAEKISGETLAKEYLIEPVGCWGCIIKCGRLVRAKTENYDVPEHESPEYESIWASGANCGIGNLPALLKINYLLNDMGIDTMSYGNVMGTAMELFEKGKITKEQTGGLDLKWGNADAAIELIWRTAHRDGFGDDLAEGCVPLAKKYGDPEAALSTRGMGLAAYDPRAMKGFALAYATSNRGEGHLRAYPVTYELLSIPKKIDPLSEDGEKVDLTIYQQNLFAVVDSLVCCKFNTFSLDHKDLAEPLPSLTGWDITPEELLKIGDRIYNMERLFSVREGKYVKDELPKRFIEVPLPDGPAKGHTAAHADKMLKEFWEKRGWIEGKPTAETLGRLDLKDFAKYV